MNDFIEIYNDVFPGGFCEHVIAEFDRHQSLGAGSSRLQSEGAAAHVKNDHQIFMNGRNLNFEPFEGRPVTDVFFEALQRCFDRYSDKYSVIRDGVLRTNAMKLQRTASGGGYHVWHGEQGNGESANRGLVYMLYLNTLAPENCGETEFLYQQRRVAPTANTMLLWPAAFTHAHRGNPVYGDAAKYIVTGWFKYE